MKFSIRKNFDLKKLEKFGFEYIDDDFKSFRAYVYFPKECHGYDIKGPLLYIYKSQRILHTKNFVKYEFMYELIIKKIYELTRKNIIDKLIEE